MNIIYSVLFSIIGILIIIFLIIIIKTVFDIDKNVVKGKDIIENVSEITQNTKNEQEKIHSMINDKIDKANIISKFKIAENLIETFTKVYRNKKKNKTL